MINKEKLENVLLTNWTHFIDVNDIRKLVHNIAVEYTLNKTCQVQTIKLTRFELMAYGFLIWINYICDGKSLTSEITASFDGIISVGSTFED